MRIPWILTVDTCVNVYSLPNWEYSWVSSYIKIVSGKKKKNVYTFDFVSL